MKCDICDEKVTTCDECGKKFHKGFTIFCNTDGFDKHECSDCYTPAEEGEVE